MDKHAQLCGSVNKRKDEVHLVDEDIDWGYRLESTPGVLIFHICAPRLVPIRGFKDRFSGIYWEPVFTAEFPAGTKQPNIVRNEAGLDFDILLSLIRAGRIVPIDRDHELDTIRNVFPCIGVYSIQMFVHIYMNKGYCAIDRLKPAVERRLFENIPGDEVWESKTAADDDGRPARNRRVKIPLYAALYRLNGTRSILQIVIKRDNRKIVLLFTKGYCSCSEPVDLRELLAQQYHLVGDPMYAIKEYDEVCPELHLLQYAKRSENVLIPIVAGDFHAGMELAAKSGATGIAEAFEQLTVFEDSPGIYRNLKDMFGLPVSVLRALDKNQARETTMLRLKEIYEYAPMFLQFDYYTDSMLEFYLRADLTHDGRRRRINGIAELSDKQILRILRYLQKHPDDGHYYCDYMNACAQLGEYPFGITPDIPIREAHDRVMARIKNKHDALTNMRFVEFVDSYSYRRLATSLTEFDRKVFEKEPFMVIIPDNADDLFIESESMHNCVRIYVDGVARKSTRIYFLRKKDKPRDSFGTLEVSSNGKSLYQAKAFSNGILDQQAQGFLVKWCKYKGIEIHTRDVNLPSDRRAKLESDLERMIKKAQKESRPA